MPLPVWPESAVDAPLPVNDQARLDSRYPFDPATLNAAAGLAKAAFDATAGLAQRCYATARVAEPCNAATRLAKRCLDHHCRSDPATDNAAARLAVPHLMPLPV